MLSTRTLGGTGVAAAAFGVQLLGLTTGQVLASAGTVGGGVVLFILPLLCERRLHRRQLMAAVAIVAAVGVMAMGGYAALNGDTTPVLRLVNLTMAVAVLPLTVRAARSAAATVLGISSSAAVAATSPIEVLVP
jgi:hypothetical protein